MPTFSALFQSPQQAELLHQRLAAAGFGEVKLASPKSAGRRASGRRKSTFTVPAPQQAEKLLRSLAEDEEEQALLYSFLDALIRDLSFAASPLKSLLNLTRLRDAWCNEMAGGTGDGTAFLRLLSDDKQMRGRLCKLLSFSQAVAETLIREPALLSLLQSEVRPRSRAQLRQELRDLLDGNAEDAFHQIHQFRHRETLRIALFDMELATWRRADDFQAVVRWISDLAAVCVEEVWRQLSGGRKLPFAVLAMGKLGARELNYSSDIDLIFIHDAPPEEQMALEHLAQQLITILSNNDNGAPLWRVDMRLRPEGKSGPLMTNLEYAFSYYESYAAPWEWQALIKARAVAGNAALARRFRRFTRDIVWAKREGDGHLQDIVDMKRRSEASNGENERNIKTGRGGIRDAEWVVQQLQLMVGPAHPATRLPATLNAIERLQAIEVLTENEARVLRDGYLLLRVVEHRLQLLDERAIRILPEDASALAALARRMGSHLRGEAAARWIEEEVARARREIRVLCEHLFWGWHGLELLGENDADLSPFYHLAPDAAKRLERMAGGTPSARFPAPLARQIKIALGPVLSQLDIAADPQRALVNLERLCDASGNRLSLLRSLEESESLGRAVSTILGGSEALSDTLIRFPELLDIAARRTQFAAPLTYDAARADCRAYCLAFRDQRAALRRWMAREMLRVGLRDLVLETSPLQICTEVSHLAHAALEFATAALQQELRPSSDLLAFSVIGLGKFGGQEMHYSSDADVIFTHEKFTGFFDSAQLADQWAGEIIRYLGEITSAGKVLDIDPRLRPEGRQGALAPSLEAYFTYFEHDISIWERQALIRARPVAGDRETAARLMAAIRRVSFPVQWRREWSDQLRHIKDRMEQERGPVHKSTFDVKMGMGTLSDIEWCAQWLAMKHGAAYPALQTARTWNQLEAASAAKVLLPVDAKRLQEAYVFLRRAELRRQIIHQRSEYLVTAGSRDFVVWARSLFPGQPEAVACEIFEEMWNNHTGAVREIFLCVRDEL